MNSTYREQIDRVKRFLAKIDPPSKEHGHQTEYEDNLWAFFQNAWHLKDWIKNDSTIMPIDIETIAGSYPNLKICADLANRSKHLKLKSSRVDAKHSKTNITVKVQPIRLPKENIGTYSAQSGGPSTSYYEYIIEENIGQEHKAIDLANAIVKDWEDLIARNVKQKP